MKEEERERGEEESGREREVERGRKRERDGAIEWNRDKLKRRDRA